MSISSPHRGEVSSSSPSTERSAPTIFCDMFLPMRLPNLNQLIERAKTSPHAYGKLKKTSTSQIAVLLRRLEPVPPAWWCFVIYEPERRRDPDNLLSAATKLVFDALQQAGKIPNDGWEQVKGIQAHFERGNGVRIIASSRMLESGDGVL